MLKAFEGDADAQFKVGVLFTNDQFSPADNEQAVYWYTQAARQNHTLAQYNLGHHYLTGLGVQQSETQAMRWWLLAAEKDHALSQFNVGRAYYLGIGLESDHALARRWFTRAAQNGEPKSADILAQLGWDDGQLANTSVTQTTPSFEPTPQRCVRTTGRVEASREIRAFGHNRAFSDNRAISNVRTDNATG